MGVFNYKGEANTLDAATLVGAGGNQIATAGWVITKISAHSPTGNCATGQTSQTSGTANTATNTSNASSISTSGTGGNTSTSSSV
jgi:hypothetical protein